MREPTELQVCTAIDAAERESRVWKIEMIGDSRCKVSDVGRLIIPGAFPQPVTVRDYDDVEKARRLVKFHVWRAGIRAVLNA
jgi:hypothetical protein